MSVFETLNAINVNDHTEKKNGLTYLSWAWAWAEVCKKYPDANFEIKWFDGKPYLYDEATGYMVFTSVTIEGKTIQMWLPLMDAANKPMMKEPYTYTVRLNGKEQTRTVQAATMFDINKTIMRCLTKNLAFFGIGLYIYAGSDLPQVEEEEANAPMDEIKKKKITEVMANAMLERMAKIGENGINVEAVCKMYKVDSIAEMNMEQYTDLNIRLNKEEKKYETESKTA